jgi:hypothetical protein
LSCFVLLVLLSLLCVYPAGRVTQQAAQSLILIIIDVQVLLLIVLLLIAQTRYVCNNEKCHIDSDLFDFVAKVLCFS